MEKEKYIKPAVKKETLEAEVLTTNHGSSGGQTTGGGNLGILSWKKNWH